MPATPLTPTKRYFAPGTRQWYWVPTIADPTAPTRAELDAGTDLTDEIVDGGVTGFVLSGETIEAPDAGGRFTPEIAARIKAGQASIKFYLDSSGGDDVRTVLHQDDAGYVVAFPEGDHPPVVGPPAKTFHMDVWPADVLTDLTADPDMSAAGATVCSFAITDEPNLNVAVPT